MTDYFADLDPPKIAEKSSPTAITPEQQSAQGGKLLKGQTPKGAHVIGADASALAKKRWDKYYENARQGVIEGVQDYLKTIENGLDTVNIPREFNSARRIIMRHAVKVLLGTTQAKGVADLSRYIDHATGVDKEEQEKTGEHERRTLSVDEAMKLIDFFDKRNREKAGVVDGTVVN